MKLSIQKFGLLLPLIGLLIPSFVFGAQVSFSPQAVSTPQSQDYTITMTVNTDGESINAIEGQVVVDTKLGQVKTVTDTGSIVTFWVTRPEINSQKNIINFSGTIPGGFNGNGGILFSLVLPNYSGEQLESAVTVVNLKALRNDGLGSNVDISTKPFIVGVNNDLVSAELLEQLYLDGRPDNIAPEIFSPQVARDDRVFDGHWFLNFATVDKQSGIDYYEVQESRSGQIKADRWRRAESPYLLQDQELRSFIYVIAVDRSGNERIIKVFPRNPTPVWQKWWPGLVLLLGFIFLGLYGYSRYKKFSQPSNL